MSKFEQSQNSEFLQEKRKLLYWISMLSSNEENTQNINLDVPELSVLLQIMGYKFETFEHIDKTDDQNMLSTIELKCNVSGTISKFSKLLSACKCPTEEEINKVQVWSVTGSSNLSSQNSINSSTSSLIPTISKGKIELISYVMAKIFNIINEKDSIEKTPTKDLSQNTLLMRYRSLDTLKGTSTSIDNVLQRTKSWEVGAPLHASSPVANVTQTLSQVSLDADSSDYVKDLREIKKLVEEKLNKFESAAKNKPKKRLSDIKPAPPSKDTNTPRKIITPKRLLSSRGDKTVIASSSSYRTPVRRQPIKPTGSDSARTKKTLIPEKNETLFKSKIEYIVHYRLYLFTTTTPVQITTGAFWKPLPDVITYSATIPLTYQSKWETSLVEIRQEERKGASCSNTDITCKIGNEIESLNKLIHKEMVRTYEAIDTKYLQVSTTYPTTKDKRALDFIGDFFSWCCGVATERKLDNLVIGYNQMKKFLKQLHSGIEHSLIQISNNSKVFNEYHNKVEENLKEIKNKVNNINQYEAEFKNKIGRTFSLTKEKVQRTIFYVYDTMIHTLNLERVVSQIEILSTCKDHKIPAIIVNPQSLQTDFKKISN
ncbi:hypothetical protein RN001_013987 [Aquatica leii]|uniref:Uncharacterized protein n=1 Tax=Aquatica leii TaxID=1421715 RepID=A0AAN7PSG2_9COLE|nr:hypothetical protein RN001_013987 [Aquatica leii]